MIFIFLYLLDQFISFFGFYLFIYLWGGEEHMYAWVMYLVPAKAHKGSDTLEQEFAGHLASYTVTWI